jgi:hypothetical protein
MRNDFDEAEITEYEKELGVVICGAQLITLIR